jgi:hypothetical protein
VAELDQTAEELGLGVLPDVGRELVERFDERPFSFQPVDGAERRCQGGCRVSIHRAEALS